MLLELELAENEMPYEKCKKFGPAVLSDAELLSIFIRTGTKNKSVLTIARDLLKDNSDGRGILRLTESTLKELTACEGIGEVKAIQLQSILEMSKRIWRMNLDNMVKFDSPECIAGYYMQEMRYLKNEVTKLLLLNTKGGLITEINLSIGTVNGSLVSTRDIFIQALKHEAVNVIILHNHPSGDPTPSREDIIVTRKVKNAGELVDIKLLDHIIIGDNKYVSLANEGLL
jgi:DNA repair protein RadC